MLIETNAELFFESKEEKEAHSVVGEIGKIRVGHEQFDSAVLGIRNCIKESIYSGEGSHCMLIGEGGMGKTSVAKLFLNSMKPGVVIENDMEISTVPVFYTSFKSARTLSALTTDILEKLKDPHPTKGTLGDKASRVLLLLKQCRTVIVFIDELHDLEGLERKHADKLRQFIKWIKELCNGCGPVICLMGIGKCYDIFDGDPEMERRFKSKFVLRGLSAGTQDEPGPLQSFVEDACLEILARTQIKSFPPLGQYLNVLRVYAATGGSPDFVMTLLKKSVLSALLGGRTSVGLEDFAQVWNSGCLDASSIVKSNPFRASHAQIAGQIRKKS